MKQQSEEPAMSMSFCYTLGGNARALEKFGAMTEEEKRQVLEAARSARSKRRSAAWYGMWRNCKKSVDER